MTYIQYKLTAMFAVMKMIIMVTRNNQQTALYTSSSFASTYFIFLIITNICVSSAHKNPNNANHIMFSNHFIFGRLAKKYVVVQ